MMGQPCEGCGRAHFCTIDIIDGMIAVGQLRYNPDTNMIAMGSWPDKGHRPRKRLLTDRRYVALRERMIAAAHKAAPCP